MLRHDFYSSCDSGISNTDFNSILRKMRKLVTHVIYRSSLLVQGQCYKHCLQDRESTASKAIRFIERHQLNIKYIALNIKN